MRPTTRSGFTLVELVAASFVVTIVVALLIPVAAKGRARARQARCVDNLRQISLAVMTYTADNDETYPISRMDPARGTGIGTQNWTWKRAILPYVRDVHIFACPSVDNRFPPCPDAPGALGDAANLRAEFCGAEDRRHWLPASYAWSGGFFTAEGQSGTLRPRRTAEAMDPNDLILIVSSRVGNTELGPAAMSIRGVDPRSGRPNTLENGLGAFVAHQGRIPFVMADGHVRALTLVETVTPVDHWRSTDPVWNGATQESRRNLVSAAIAAQNSMTEYHE